MYQCMVNNEIKLIIKDRLPDKRRIETDLSIECDCIRLTLRTDAPGPRRVLCTTRLNLTAKILQWHKFPSVMYTSNPDIQYVAFYIYTKTFLFTVHHSMSILYLHVRGHFFPFIFFLKISRTFFFTIIRMFKSIRLTCRLLQSIFWCMSEMIET